MNNNDDQMPRNVNIRNVRIITPLETGNIALASLVRHKI